MEDFSGPMARLFPLDTSVPCDVGANHDVGGGAAATRARPTPEQGKFVTQAQATGSGSWAQSGVMSAPRSANVAHVSTPLQSLTSGPRRILGDERELRPPFEVTGPHSSSSPSSHFSPGERGNPTDSFRIVAERRKEATTRLPHEVRDHPDTDLSARLVHLWNHIIDVGVGREVFVQSSDKLVSGLPEVAPLHGASPTNPRWSTLGGDTQSFSQVLQAPL
jgi:hypothetical protein